MSKRDKLLHKISSNYKDVLFSDLQNLLKWDGWVIHTQNATHYTYFKRGYGRLTIPKKGKKVKEYYVKQALKIMGVEL